MQNEKPTPEETVVDEQSKGTAKKRNVIGRAVDRVRHRRDEATASFKKKRELKAANKQAAKAAAVKEVVRKSVANAEAICEIDELKGTIVGRLAAMGKLASAAGVIDDAMESVSIS